jgi:hypothetical protein
MSRPVTIVTRPLKELRRPLKELRRPLTELRRPLTELSGPLTTIFFWMSRPVKCIFSRAMFSKLQCKTIQRKPFTVNTCVIQHYTVGEGFFHFCFQTIIKLKSPFNYRKATYLSGGLPGVKANTLTYRLYYRWSM